MMHDDTTTEIEMENTSASDWSVAPSGPVKAEDIQRWMVTKIAETLHIKPEEVDIRAPFVSYGLESIVVFSLTGDLADWLDRDLEATLLWEHPTIEDLSQHLSRQISAEA